MVRQINLTESNGERVEELSRQTGKPPDQIVNEVVDRLVPPTEQQEREKFKDWKAALLQVEGIWKDRDDLPDFDALRRSWDRDYIDRENG